MSNLTHCDGPKCEVRKDDNGPARAWSEGSWIKVQDNWHDFDFHSPACLLAHYGAERESVINDHIKEQTA